MRSDPPPPHWLPMKLDGFNEAVVKVQEMKQHIKVFKDNQLGYLESLDSELEMMRERFQLFYWEKTCQEVEKGFVHSCLLLLTTTVFGQNLRLEPVAVKLVNW